MSRARAAAAPERIRWAVAQLALSSAAQVLEIGCGAGHAVALVAEQLSGGTITGIDRSQAQVRLARQRNAAAITAGRARIEPLSLEEAPDQLGERRYHAILAINVNAFWTHPEPSIRAAHRLLRRRGRLCLCYEPPSAARLSSLQQTLPTLLENEGIRVRDIRASASARSRKLCIIGVAG